MLVWVSRPRLQFCSRFIAIKACLGSGSETEVYGLFAKSFVQVSGIVSLYHVVGFVHGCICLIMGIMYALVFLK